MFDITGRIFTLYYHLNLKSTDTLQVRRQEPTGQFISTITLGKQTVEVAGVVYQSGSIEFDATLPKQEKVMHFQGALGYASPESERELWMAGIYRFFGFGPLIDLPRDYPPYIFPFYAEENTIF